MGETKQTEPSPAELQWAGQVWKRMSRTVCGGVLHIALGYGERLERTNAYIDQMAEQSWIGLGLPLQMDVARALLKLRLVVNS